MKLDEKLVRLRKKKGLTQLELAEAVKVSRQAVSKWESGGGMPSTENLRGLSELYGVSVNFLLNEEERKPEDSNVPKEKTENSPEPVRAELVIDGYFVEDKGNKRMLKQLSKGLNANQVKWIALVFMTIDHINEYILSAGVNLVQNGTLRDLGRIAAPLFLFVLTESVRHTKDKRRLILRLYIAGALGSLFTISFTILANEFVFFGPIYMGMPKNILFTYTYTAIYICLLECGMKYIRTKNMKGVFITVAGVMATFLPQIVYSIYDVAGFHSISVGFVSLQREVLAAFLPPTFFIEYSLMFVLMGICIYFSKGKWKCLVFAAFCVLSYLGAPIVSNLWPFTDFFWQGQAWMILAIPFMFLYNGEKGTAHKTFFYVYYPAHRVLLSFVGVLMEG